jgi:hypothetical protein
MISGKFTHELQPSTHLTFFDLKRAELAVQELAPTFKRPEILLERHALGGGGVEKPPGGGLWFGCGHDLHPVQELGRMRVSNPQNPADLDAQRLSGSRTRTRYIAERMSGIGVCPTPSLL